MTEILEILKAEHKRIAKMLPSLDPITEGYTNAMRNLAEVSWRIDAMEHPCVDPDLGCTPVPASVTPKEPEPTPEEPVHTQEPEPAPEEPEPTPEEPKAEETPVVVDGTTDWAAYRVALRERMADARIDGLDTKALLAKVGASKFSTIPDEELPALAAALDEALKEKG